MPATRPNADRFERAGIYFACTTVEGYLHQDQDVAVIGAGNSAGQAAMFLVKHCARTVHMLIRKDVLGPGMSVYLAARIRTTPSIIVHTGVKISEVHGTRHVEGLTLKHAKDGGKERLDIGAGFVFIGAEPLAAWLPDTIARDKLGYPLTGADAVTCGRWPLKDREPCPLETTMPGVLAAGIFARDRLNESVSRWAMARCGDLSASARSYAHA